MNLCVHVVVEVGGGVCVGGGLVGWCVDGCGCVVAIVIGVLNLCFISTVA